MEITVVGAGYVGLVTGTCLAELGHKVMCVESNPHKLQLLQAGQTPIYEPCLDLLIQKNMEAGRLSFTDDIRRGVDYARVIFIAVGTPSAPDGSADLSQVISAAYDIGSTMKGAKLIVNKSTVPVGTADMVRKVIENAMRTAGHGGLMADVVSNPEFLKEGTAVDDFLNPDRIIVGSDCLAASITMQQIYKPMTENGVPLLIIKTRSAEVCKYACNAMRASRISFMNEISRLCEEVGADVEEVRQGMALDKVIGSQFLRAGPGYGGSCFPKDVQALNYIMERYQIDADLIGAIEIANIKQKRRILDRIMAAFDFDVEGVIICIWGSAFKPGTDDVRDSPAIYIATQLVQQGAVVKIHDPVALPNTMAALKEVEDFFPSKIFYCEQPYQAAEGASMLVLMTEWPDYANPIVDLLSKHMDAKAIFDTRNFWEPTSFVMKGFAYEGVGRHVRTDISVRS